jgi:hypothetical protein
MFHLDRYDKNRTRDLQVTPADSVRWLFQQGHISRRQAGQLTTV